MFEVLIVTSLKFKQHGFEDLTVKETFIKFLKASLNKTENDLTFQMDSARAELPDLISI